MDIPEIVSRQKEFFLTHRTKELSFRKAALKRLRAELIRREPEILKALFADFKKPPFEGVMSETALVINELDLLLKNLEKWSKPKRVAPVLLTFPSTSMLLKEPYGTVLIISPWNYPYQLAIAPLIGALAAGNTVVIKPSEMTPNTSALLSGIIRSVFDEEHVKVVEGDASAAQALLREKWDYIFFTGSIPVGKIIAKAAAENLTPVTLELGGKNPCIIDKNIDIGLAARRTFWGKCVNAGQTCIAPDYILVHEEVKDRFVAAFREEIRRSYGEDPRKSADYPRIINARRFDTLREMIDGEKVMAGGDSDRDELYISPTLIDNPETAAKSMEGEIFGPVMPVISFTDHGDLERIIRKYDKPLAFYIFSNNRRLIRKLLSEYSFGGGTINDTTVHFANHRLPFGGVGYSGTGAYHGKYSFDTFTHTKGITIRYNWLDIPLRYPPYRGKMKILKFMMRWMR